MAGDIPKATLSAPRVRADSPEAPSGPAGQDGAARVEKAEHDDWQGVAGVLDQEVEALADATRMPGAAYQSRLVVEGTRLPDVGYQSRLATAKEEAPPERYAIGDLIGDRYEVLAIHTGTMGVVYGTFDRQTKLPRALKTFRHRFAANRRMHDLFRAEAAIWVRLEKHPFIVRAHLVERFDNEQPYVVTEYIRGEEGVAGDLRGWLGHPRLTLAVAAELALQIAQGMQHATRKVPGLVHRDLKPANILVDDRARALVTDFGLAHAAEGDAGTPAYMAPEQWRGQALDQRADLYAFGCILYEMLTGRRLYAAATLEDWKTAHLFQAPVPPRDLEPDLPAVLDDLIRHCLAKEVSARPASWDAVVSACASAFHQVTGQPAVLDFSAYELSADELVSASYSLSRLFKHSEMLDVCDRAITISPDYTAAWHNKGFALQALQRYDEAITCYERIIEIDPGRTSAWCSKGEALAHLNRLEESMACYDHAIAIDAQNSEAWIRKGNVLTPLLVPGRSPSTDELSRYDQAIACYRRAVDIEPGNSAGWSHLGDAFEDIGRYDEAFSCYDHVLQIDPLNHDVWFGKGVTLEGLGRYEEAIVCHEHAIAADPRSTSGWVGKAEALRNLKLYDEALLCYDRALDLDPSDSSCVWMSKGDVLAELHRFDEAIASYDRELEIYLSFNRVLLNKGRALNNLSRHAEAIACFDRALADEGGGLWAAQLRDAKESATAAALVQAAGRDQVIASCDRALMTHPYNPTLWYTKGLRLEALKRYAEAFACYDRAFEIEPAGAWAARLIAVTDTAKTTAFDQRACSDEAIACYDRAIRINPLDTDAWYNKGVTLEGLQRYDDAIACYERVLEVDPCRSSAWASKADVLTNLRRFDEAFLCYDRARELDSSC